MFKYNVCDFDFRFVGIVEAWTPEDALVKAKRKFRMAIAPMVWPKPAIRVNQHYTGA